jgi:integrase/recombinase XerC
MSIFIEKSIFHRAIILFMRGEIHTISCCGGKYNNKPGLIYAIHDFLIHLKAGGYASNTICCYSQSLKWLVEILGNMSLNNISEKHLANAVIELTNSNSTGAKRSTATMNRIKSAYRSFFKWSLESERISFNPCASLHVTNANSQRTIPITIEEINIFLDTVRKSSDPCAGRDEALFAIYAFTGIRRSEALTLKVKDYDAVSSSLYLSRIKGGSARLQPVPPRLTEILERHISDLKQNKRVNADSSLFSSIQSERSLSVRHVQVRFDKWKNIAGIRENLTIHSFRAGFATLLYETKGDLLLVSRAMGHRDVRTTERYIANNMNAVREAMDETFH